MRSTFNVTKHVNPEAKKFNENLILFIEELRLRLGVKVRSIKKTKDRNGFYEKISISNSCSERPRIIILVPNTKGKMDCNFSSEDSSQIKELKNQTISKSNFFKQEKGSAFQEMLEFFGRV